MPAIAPGAVSPRHQMPSTSNGQNVDAASANANVTELATAMRSAESASTSGTTTPPTAAQRMAVMFDMPPRWLMAWPTTPGDRHRES